MLLSFHRRQPESPVRRASRILGLWCAWALALVSATDTSADSTVTPRPGDPALLGQGYSGLSGRFAGSCVERKPTAPVTEGQDVEFEVRQVTSTKELAEELGLNASVSARWGIGGASASFKHLTSSSMTSFGVTFVVRVRVDNGTTVLADPSLTPKARKLLLANASSFGQTCGDEFVRGLSNGGEFTATLTVETTSVRDHQDVSSAFQGSYVGVSGAASFSESLKQVASTHSVQARVVMIGGVGSVPPLNPEALLAFARDFPNLVKDTRRPWMLNTAPYTVLTDLPRRPLSHLAQQALMFGLGQRLDRAIQARNDLLFAQNHPEQFCDPPLQQIAEQVPKLEDYIGRIGAHARKCYEGAAAAAGTKACKPFTEAVPQVAEVVRRLESASGTAVVQEVEMTMPVEIALPVDKTCQIAQITGRWAYYANGEETQICPGVTIENGVARSEFDSKYGDNAGKCKYTFTCFSSAVKSCKDDKSDIGKLYEAASKG
jgi:hypothetical protein